MAEEIKNPPVSEVEKILEVLNEDYGIDLGVLAKAIGLEKDMLENFAERKDSIPETKMFQLVGMLGSISYLPNIEPDDRTRAVLDILVNVHGIPVGSVACLARVTMQEMVDFISKEDVATEVKYKITSTAMMLHFLFKPGK